MEKFGWSPMFININHVPEVDFNKLKLRMTYFTKDIAKLEEAVAKFYAPLNTQEEIYQSIIKLVDKLKSLKNAYIFSEPVDWKALQLDDYPEIIKHPMDFQTLAIEMKKASISAIEVYRLIDLIYHNAMMYNPVDDWVHALAKEHQKSFYRRLTDRSSGPRSIEDMMAINLIIESNFADIRVSFDNLSDDQLSAMTKMINMLNQSELSTVFNKFFPEIGESVPTTSTFTIKSSSLAIQRLGDMIYNILKDKNV